MTIYECMLSLSQLLDVKGVPVNELINKINKQRKEIPWVDKYRPKKIKNIIHQTEVVKMLNKVLETGELPHLLFYGPPGSGKTSSMLAICRELFGPKRFHERVIELNASDERGINIVRKKIVTFAKNSIGTADPDYLCPPYKVIILDEADAMTTEAQSALRKVMEDHSNITRFCFICNYINQIISPIISRCVPFRFKPIEGPEMIKKLSYITYKEELECDSNCIECVVEVSNGDMRKAITFLQNLKYISKIKKRKLIPHDVYDAANCIPTDHMNVLWKKCKKPLKKTDITPIRNIGIHLQRLGYPINNILNKIQKCLVNDEEITDKQKAKISMHLSNFERRLIEGGDEYIQLLNSLLYINIVVNE